MSTERHIAKLQVDALDLVLAMQPAARINEKAEIRSIAGLDQALAHLRDSDIPQVAQEVWDRWTGNETELAAAAIGFLLFTMDHMKSPEKIDAYLQNVREELVRRLDHLENDG